MLQSLRVKSLWLPLCVLLLLAMAVSLTVGQYPLSLDTVLPSLWRGTISGGFQAEQAPVSDTVVWSLRLPRVTAAALVGAALSAAGAAYQGMFRNPLVSPDILGVSTGAGLGATLAIFMGWSMFWVQASAFVAGLAAVAAVYFIAGMVRRHDAVLVLVLAGVAVSTLLGAAISLIKILADPYTQLPTITYWLLGGLHTITGDDLPRMLPWVLAGLMPMLLLRWRINLLSLSDDEANTLGVRATYLRALLIVAATMMTASVVSFTGIIGWVGLVIPHVARLLAGPEFSRLLPASLLLGALFLVLTDTLARSAAGIELPLGILTALVGAPFFLALLAKGPRQ